MNSVVQMFRLALCFQAILIALDLTTNALVIPKIANTKTKRSMVTLTHLYCKSLLRHRKIALTTYLEHCGGVTGMKRSAPGALKNIFLSQEHSLEEQISHENENRLIQDFFKLLELIDEPSSSGVGLSEAEKPGQVNLNIRPVSLLKKLTGYSMRDNDDVGSL